jgi:hypothetical protein
MWTAVEPAARRRTQEEDATASGDTDIFYTITRVADAAALEVVSTTIDEASTSGDLLYAFKEVVAATDGLDVAAITATDTTVEQTESGEGLSVTSGAAAALPALAAAAVTVLLTLML